MGYSPTASLNIDNLDLHQRVIKYPLVFNPVSCALNLVLNYLPHGGAVHALPSLAHHLFSCLDLHCLR